MIERNIEDKLIEYLTKNKGYEYIEIHSPKDIDDNIIKQLSRLNRREITEANLNKISGDLRQAVGTAACYALKFNDFLANGVFLPKTSGVGREAVMLMSKAFSDNTFQIARQVTDKGSKHSRYDVTILMNGFPIIQIELKNIDVEIEAAVNQINRYIDTAFTDWFKYIQLFVVSNETNTRYSINNNTKLNKRFMFKWSDENNNIIDNLYKFADTFFDRHNICDILLNYIVKYKTEDRMVVLRPYQIFAIKAAMRQIRKPMKAIRSIDDNGFIFHTTGSGKTLTSFKCMQLASAEPSDIVAKVVFLVDRRDLDSQTTAEFKSISSSVDIADTDSTKALLNCFETEKAIITTIQKFSIAVNKANNGDPDYQRVFGAYKDKKIVFIVDECHRTQFGKMHSSIDNYFKYSQYIGFTGTPISEKNALEKSQTTESLFGKVLHNYRIDEAIRDKNVLGFSVDYHNTVKVGNKYYELSDDDTSMYNLENYEEIINHPDRISGIVDKIFEIHNKKTINRRYTAILAVSSISSLLKYYDEFKNKNRSLNEKDKLRVSAIFTATDYSEAESGDSYKDRFNEIMKDFNIEFHVNCTDDETFRSELTKSMKCLRDPHLDILIVVNMFLTGFDSKRTNTLYVDKNLEWHGLLQAFSRTNRVESELKPFGNVVCFRPLKKNVDDAIELFTSGVFSGVYIAKSYQTCLDNLIKIAKEVMDNVPEDLNLDNSTESEKITFVKSMRKLNKAFQETSQFGEFSWDALSKVMTEDDYRRLVGQYKSIGYNTELSEKESILNYIDFCMELIEEDKIDLDYIKQLIENVDISTLEATEVSARNIRDLLERSSSDSVVSKKELINRFLDRLVMEKKANKVSSKADINSLFRNFVETEKQKEVKELSLEAGIDKETIHELIDDYNITGKVVSSEIRTAVREGNKNLGFKKRASVVETIKNFIPKFIKKFDFF